VTVFGSSRSRVCKDHALIAPESFVQSTLPGWDKTQGIILIAPAMGARFSQYLALLDPGGGAGPALPGVERVLFVLDGEVDLKIGREPEHRLGIGGFAFVPADIATQARARNPCRLNLLEKRYLPLPGVESPRAILGHEQ